MGRYSTTISLVKSNLSYPTASDPGMNNGHHIGWFFIRKVIFWKSYFLLLSHFTWHRVLRLLLLALVSELIVEPPCLLGIPKQSLICCIPPLGIWTFLKLGTNYLLSTNFLPFFFTFSLSSFSSFSFNLSILKIWSRDKNGNWHFF